MMLSETICWEGILFGEIVKHIEHRYLCSFSPVFKDTFDTDRGYTKCGQIGTNSQPPKNVCRSDDLGELLTRSCLKLLHH